MALLNSLERGRRRDPRAAVQQGDGGTPITSPKELQDFILGVLGSSTASGATVTPDSAMRVAAVYGCVRIISQGVAALPLNLMRRLAEDKREKATDHPLHKLLHLRPNAWQTSYEFRQMMTGQVCLRGNAYALKVKSGRRVLELIPLHPDRVEVEQRDDLSIVYRWIRRDGRRVEFTGGKDGDILHFRGLTTDGVMGLSPIGAAREAVGLAMQTEKHGAKLFAQGAQHGGIIKHPEHLSAEAHGNLKSDFEEKYAGVDNAHKTILLEEGMDWVKVGMTAEDAQFLETRKFQRSEIAMFFGIPPHMLGDVDKTTSWGSGIEQQGIGFLQYTLAPWLVSDEQALARDLLTEAEEDELYFNFNVKGLLRGDFKSRQEGLQIQRRNGVINADEWRGLEDFNPRDDDGGKEYIVERNMGPQSGADPAPTE